MKERVNFSKKLKTLTKSWLHTLSLMACVPLLTQCGTKDISLSATLDWGSSSIFGGLRSTETLNGTSIKLTWSPSSQSNITHYNIYDVTFPFFDIKQFGTVLAPGVTFTANGLIPAKIYRFRVRAADASNNEDPNTTDLSAIPYAGIQSFQSDSSTTEIITVADTTGSDSVTVTCFNYSTGAPINLTTPHEVLSPTSLRISGLTAGITVRCKANITLSGVTDNNKRFISFTPVGFADHLTLTQAPTSKSAGNSHTVRVEIRDDHDQLVSSGPDTNGTITLTLMNAEGTEAIASNPIVNYAMAAENGVATFSYFQVKEAGTFKVKASGNFSGTGTQKTVEGLTAGSFTISPGDPNAAQSLVTVSSPSPVPVVSDYTGTTTPTQHHYTVTVTLKDRFGNPIPGVTPTFQTNYSVGYASTRRAHIHMVASDETGTAQGWITSTQANSSGWLKVSSPVVLPSGAALPIPFSAGAATKLHINDLNFSGNPGVAGKKSLPEIQVEVRDSFGNAVTGWSSPITLALTSAPTGAGFLTPGGGANPSPVPSVTMTNSAGASTVSFTGYGLSKTARQPNFYKLSATSSDAVSGRVINSDSAVNPFNLPVGGDLFQISISTNPTPSPSNSPPVVASAGNCRSLVFSTADFYGNLPGSLPAGMASPTLSGLGGSSAQLFAPSSGSCTCSGTNLSSASVPIQFPVSSSGSSNQAVSSRTYCMTDPAAEVLPLEFTVNGQSGPRTTLTVAPVSLGIYSGATLVSDTTLPVPASSCKPLTLKFLDSQGNPANVGANTNITVGGLSATSANLYESESNCTNNTTTLPSTFSMTPASAQKQLWFKDEIAETFDLTFAAAAWTTSNLQGPPSTTARTARVTLGVGASQLAIVAPTRSFGLASPVPSNSPATNCLGPFYVQTIDGTGSAHAPSSAVTVNVSASPLAAWAGKTVPTFWGAYTCGSPANSVTSLTVPTTSPSSQPFYIKGNAAGVFSISATANAYVSGTAEVRYGPARLGITAGVAGVAPYPVNSCIPVQIKALDPNEVPSNAIWNTTAQLTASHANTDSLVTINLFTNLSNCNNRENSLTSPTASFSSIPTPTENQFWLKTNTTGNVTLTATDRSESSLGANHAIDLAQGTLGIPIGGASVDHIDLLFSGTPIPTPVISPGACQRFTLAPKDAFGNVPTSGPTSFSISSGNAQIFPLSGTGTCTCGSATQLTGAISIDHTGRDLCIRDYSSETVSLSVLATSYRLYNSTHSITFAPGNLYLVNSGTPITSSSTLPTPAGSCVPLDLTFYGAAAGATAASPATASTTATITVSSLGDASIFPNATCTAPPAPTASFSPHPTDADTLVFTPATAWTSQLISIRRNSVGSITPSFSASVTSSNVGGSTVTSTPTTNALTLRFLPSQLSFGVSPSHGKTGECVGPFNVYSQGANGTDGAPASDLSVALSSSGSTLYSSSACNLPLTSPITIPSSSSSTQAFYLKNPTVGSFTLTASTSGLTNGTHTVTIGPSQLAVSPVPSVTSGPDLASLPCTPITVTTQNNSGTPQNVQWATTIQVSVSPSPSPSTMWLYNSDCSTQYGYTTPVTLLSGSSSATLGFKSIAPQANVTITATDTTIGKPQMSPSTQSFSVAGIPGWIGTGGASPIPVAGVGNNVINPAPSISISSLTAPQITSYLQDGPGNPSALAAFSDASNTFLYVADGTFGRILKYNLKNGTYLGWIGIVGSQTTGSTQSGTLGTACTNTAVGNFTPGWCVGGRPKLPSDLALTTTTVPYTRAFAASFNATVAPALKSPSAIAATGTFIYVADSYQNIVARYDAPTGAFAGWLGYTGHALPTSYWSPINTASPSPMGGWSSGTPTPNRIPNPGTTSYDFSPLVNPKAIAVDSNYLYVGTGGKVQRFTLSGYPVGYTFGDCAQGTFSYGANTYTGWAASCSNTYNSSPLTDDFWFGPSCYRNGAQGGYEYAFGCHDGVARLELDRASHHELARLYNPSGLTVATPSPGAPSTELLVTDAQSQFVNAGLQGILVRFKINTSTPGGTSPVMLLGSPKNLTVNGNALPWQGGSKTIMSLAAPSPGPRNILTHYPGNLVQDPDDATLFYLEQGNQIDQIRMNLAVPSPAPSLVSYIGKLSSSGQVLTDWTNIDTRGVFDLGAGMEGNALNQVNGLVAIPNASVHGSLKGSCISTILITSESGTGGPHELKYSAIKFWCAGNPAYLGTLQLNANQPNPTRWSQEVNLAVANYGLNTSAFAGPSGMYIDKTNRFLYTVETKVSRVKKINLDTGEVTQLAGYFNKRTPYSPSIPRNSGYREFNSSEDFGPLTDLIPFSNPTPLISDSGLELSFRDRYSTGYQDANSFFLPVRPIMTLSQLAKPVDVTGDGTSLYVVDKDQNLIVRYDLNGVFQGWLGKSNCSFTLSIPPEALTAGTNSLCNFNQPTSAQFTDNALLVLDAGNNRVVKIPFSAGNPSGVTVEWKGLITSQLAFSSSLPTVNPFPKLSADSNFLYITNSDKWRIDALNKTDGTFAYSIPFEPLYADGDTDRALNCSTKLINWHPTTDGTPDGCSTNPTSRSALNGTTVRNLSKNINFMSSAIWADPSPNNPYIYTIQSTPDRSGSTTYPYIVVKRPIPIHANSLVPNRVSDDLSTGKISWAGAGCATTPQTWCTMPSNATNPNYPFNPNLPVSGVGARYFEFLNAYNITGDDHYIYISDQGSNRIVRLPK